MVPIRHFFKPIRTFPDFSIRGIGILEQRLPGITDRPSGTGDYLFMYLYEAASFATKDGIGKHKPGTVVIWRPTDRQYYGSTEHPWKHSWIHCDGNWVRRCLKNCGLSCNTAIAITNASIFECYLRRLYDELTHFTKPDARIVRDLFEIWLCELQRRVSGEIAPSAIPPEFQALKSYIEINFSSDLSLESLTQRVHLSVPRLCCLFKRYFSCSVMAYVIELRLHHAAYLLHDHNLRIADIAREVGYENEFHFSRLFKHRFGASPRKFRDNLEHDT